MRPQELKPLSKDIGAQSRASNSFPRGLAFWVQSKAEGKAALPRCQKEGQSLALWEPLVWRFWRRLRTWIFRTCA